MWIFAGVRMLNHSAGGLRFLNYPRAITFFQIIGDLHARTGGCAGLGPKDNLGVRLIAIDGNASDIHIHGAHVERTDAVEMLKDAGANGVIVARLLLATAAEQESGGEAKARAMDFMRGSFPIPEDDSFIHLTRTAARLEP